MKDILFIANIFPLLAYKYVVVFLMVVFIFREKIPVINKIDVRVRLPEEFMRNFRWITPLLVFGMYIWAVVIFLMLKAVLSKFP